ncbi:hypothetical protein D3C84_960450 [compost metagenome]
MENAPQVKAKNLLDDVIGVAPFGFQAHQETGRYRQRPVSGLPGKRFVGVNRVGLANRLGKKTQAALFNFTAGHTQ